MNGIQEERLRELEDVAIDICLEAIKFNPSLYLEGEELKEYCELYNTCMETLDCVCGKHIGEGMI